MGPGVAAAMLTATAGLVAAGDVPTLSSMATAIEPVRVCQPPFWNASPPQPCPGFTDPQIAGMVPGDAQALCFHLGCCWHPTGHPTDRTKGPRLGRGLGGDESVDGGNCVAAADAAAADTDGTMYWAGNQPIPALSNTRGVAQLPLETADPLAVDCLYFPPFFGTCDGSRSDSRDDRANKIGPVVAGEVTVGGATANLTVNGERVKVLAHKWAPAEMRRTAGSAGLPAGLEVSTAVRMPLFESAALLELTVTNANVPVANAADADGQAGGRDPEDIAVDITFETPFVTRWFDEIEGVRQLRNFDGVLDQPFLRGGFHIYDLCPPSLLRAV